MWLLHFVVAPEAGHLTLKRQVSGTRLVLAGASFPYCQVTKAKGR